MTFGQFVRLCYNEENEADVFKQEVFPTLCVKQATLKYTQTVKQAAGCRIVDKSLYCIIHYNVYICFL